MPIGDLNTQLWVDLLFYFRWILLMPVGVAVVLLMLSSVLGVAGRTIGEPQRKDGF